jgi:hypothetical protein
VLPSHSSSVISGNIDKVVLLADIKDFDKNADIPNLIKNTTMLFYPHDKVAGVDTGMTDLIQWNEDGFAVEGSFDLNIDKSALLNTLEFKLVAHNQTTNSFFELDSYSYNIGGATISNGIQQLNITEDRGYNLANNSQFNKAELTTGTLTSGLQNYTYKFSQKTSWQDWIKNNNANSIFYDNSKNNDNLNFRASNYSNLNVYNIRMLMFANVFGVDDLGTSGLTDYAIFSPNLTVYDYDKDGQTTPVWSATIETFNAANNSNLGGSILTGNDDTLFKITWVNSVAPITTLTDTYAIHRIEETNQNGYDIDELSTINPFPNGNRLQPKSGFVQLDMYIDSGNIVTEGIIKGNTLTEGVSYNLSGRIHVGSTTPFFGKLKEGGVQKTTEAGLDKTIE